MPRPAAASGRKAWLSSPQAAGWLLLAPPVLLMGVRSVLDELAGRASPAGVALPLVPVSAPAGVMDLLGPVLAGLVLMVLLGAVIWRMGWRRVAPVAATAWVLLWVGGTAALLQRHLNLQGLRPLPAATATVLASQFKPPSLRGAGGTQLFLTVTGLPGPQRVLIDDASLRALQSGDRLQLQLSSGRWSGHFVTGWQTLPQAAPSLR